MKPTNGSRCWLAIASLLILANAIWMTWNWFHYDKVRSTIEHFNVVNIHTNSADGISILDKQTGQPIWSQLDFDGDGKPDTVSYFFQGNNVMNIHLKEGRLPRREVLFYGEDGKVKVSWADRSGSGLFTERIFYEDGEPRLEVWYRQMWFVTEERNNKRGIVIDGHWLRLTITNGFWIPESEMNP